MKNKSFIDCPVFFILWAIVSALGWLAGILDLTSNAKTYLEVARLIPIYLLDGLLVGLVTGMGQALILRRVHATIIAVVLEYSFRIRACFSSGTSH